MAAELVAAGVQRGGRRLPVQQYYCGQAGWSGCTWGGVLWVWFVAADWETVGQEEAGVVHAGGTEGSLAPWTIAADLRIQLPAGCFGGVICVREGYRAEHYPVLAYPADISSDSEDY